MSRRPHPTVEDLDDAVDGTAAPDVTGHLATCGDCRAAVAALARIRIDLAALEPVEMPADVTARIELALRAEQVRDTGPEHSGAARHGRTGQRWGTARTATLDPTRRRSVPRRPALIGVAAGVAVLAVAGAVLGLAVSTGDGSGGTSSTAGAAAVAGPEARVPPAPSGQDPTAATRVQRAPEAAYDRGTVAEVAAGVDAGAATTVTGPAVPTCLALATRPATVVRVVQADFEGSPAVIGVVTAGTGLRVVVVGRSCPGATSVRPLYAVSVPATATGR